MERDEFYDALYLAHHGVKGQKWGVRRYQNEDGSLTPEGKRREDSNDSKPKNRLKTVAKVGLGIAGTALAAYGAYKLSTNSKVRSAVQKGMESFQKSPSVEEMMSKGPEIVRRSDNSIKEYKPSLNLATPRPKQSDISLTLNPSTKPGVDYNAKISENVQKIQEELERKRNQNRR